MTSAVDRAQIDLLKLLLQREAEVERLRAENERLRGQVEHLQNSNIALDRHAASGREAMRD